MNLATYLKINPADSVVVCLQPKKKGDIVEVDGRNIVLNQDTPAGHKVLIKDVKEGVSFNGNHAQIERLVSVLTENASKYVSDGGVVRIGLTVGQRYTTMTFYNTCEIDPQADFTHLFDRFYRTDASRTSKTGGHGIGLSIAKRIVDLHNGTISAIPQNDGLLFQVRLSNKLKKGKRKQSK